MKNKWLVLILLISATCLRAQHLVNYYNVCSEVYGGMEDGGISKHESYFFKVNAKITLPQIYLAGEQLCLRKGDTLIINVTSFEPYNGHIRLLSDSLVVHGTLIDTLPGHTFSVNQYGHRYYANYDSGNHWNKEIVYISGKRSYTVRAREEFDAWNRAFAP